MPYRPKFCCECGEPIERTEWTLFASRRFCESCEIDHKPAEWIPRIVVLGALLFGVFGLGTFLQKTEKPLNLATGNAANANKNAAGAQVSINANVQTFAKIQETNVAVQQSLSKSAVVQPKPDLRIQKAENQSSAAPETIYFCGAETKKGTPCTRHVKSSGQRCWQHTGKPAILPPEKLIAQR